MHKKGAAKSFKPGTHLFVPYCGRVHEVVVEEHTTGMDHAFVYVRFLKPPDPVVGKRFVNPRSVRKICCFTKPKYALNDALRWYRTTIKDLEYKVRWYQKRLDDTRKVMQEYTDSYKEEYSDGD